MAFMERGITPSTAGTLMVVRPLRRHCVARDDDGERTALSRLAVLGQTPWLPPAGAVALESVSELAEAVLRRRLTIECSRLRSLSADESAA